jgi:peptide-methionine (S)-S-oxide reductase
MELKTLIDPIPEGYSEAWYQGRKYGLSRHDFNGGRSSKVFAQELGGRNFISFNYYRTRGADRLKPCEMPEDKVIHFLLHLRWDRPDA